jgi:c-di-GMP-binding flagellar brake protein YcgR/CheY-like chemotaxis protein
MTSEASEAPVPDPFEGPPIMFPEDEAGLAPLLAVGKPVVFYPDDDFDEAAMERAVVRGWHPDSYVLLELPRYAEDEVPHRMGTPLLIKFRHEGVTHEFDSSLLERWSGMDTAHVLASWPDKVRRVEVRKHERIVSMVQVNVVTEEGAWLKGQLRDLSAGGCKLYLKTPAETGTVVHLSFSLPDGSTLEDVRAFVKSINPFGKGALVSCQFDEDEHEAQEEVDLYVSTALDESRARHLPDRRRVVVIDGAPKLLGNLRKALSQRGFDVATAGGAVDGFAVMRATMPHAVLINQEQSPVSGYDLVRILRTTPGYKKLPIFLYGPESMSLARRAHEAGATEYIPYLINASRIAESVFSDGLEG